jgi:DNA-binding response OmpR family regulator
MTAALLLAEPEPATRGYLERQLASDGFHVLQAAFGGEALALAERTRPDLVVCSELDLCARLREGEPGRTWNRDVPVIVLGPEEADAVDRVRAFQRGADDYLPRPVVYDELLARIRAVLRRTSPPCPDLIEVGDLAIDRPARVVTVRGEPVHLAGKEFELLVALAAEPTRVFTKDELLRDVWGFRSFTRTRTLDSHVSRLRQKLERAPATTSSSTSGAWVQARRLTKRVALSGAPSDRLMPAAHALGLLSVDDRVRAKAATPRTRPPGRCEGSPVLAASSDLEESSLQPQ